MTQSDRQDRPYITAEIRWFVPQGEELWSCYIDSLYPGQGSFESRTDHYLSIPLTSTGIKIRNARHELKVRFKADQPWPRGNIQHWAKWSHATQEDILQTIAPDLSQDWLAVEKHRYLKTVEFRETKMLPAKQVELPAEGVSLEWSHIKVPALQEETYSLALEAFSSRDQASDYLRSTLEALTLPSICQARSAMSYPEWLAGIRV